MGAAAVAVRAHVHTAAQAEWCSHADGSQQASSAARTHNLHDDGGVWPDLASSEHAHNTHSTGHQHMQQHSTHAPTISTMTAMSGERHASVRSRKMEPSADSTKDGTHDTSTHLLHGGGRDEQERGARRQGLAAAPACGGCGMQESMRKRCAPVCARAPAGVAAHAGLPEALAGARRAGLNERPCRCQQDAAAAAAVVQQP